jgi:putative phosphoesterase
VDVVATLGVISDTHGLLRPEVRAAFASVDRIIHAGDIEDPQALQLLGGLAPVTAVRGNCDHGAWVCKLPDHETIMVEGFAIHVLHDLGNLTIDPKADGIAAVICGHTHRPQNQVRGGILYFNPGSAGPHRQGDPVSFGKLRVGPNGVTGEIILL